MHRSRVRASRLVGAEATVLVGGDGETFRACADRWAVTGQRVFPVGPCGSAAKMKLVSNLVLGLNRAALAEGLVYAASTRLRRLRYCKGA